MLLAIPYRLISSADEMAEQLMGLRERLGISYVVARKTLSTRSLRWWRAWRASKRERMWLGRCNTAQEVMWIDEDVEKTPSDMSGNMAD